MKTAKEYLEPTRLYRLPEQFGLKMPTDKCDFNAAVKVIEQVIQDCKPKWIEFDSNTMTKKQQTEFHDAPESSLVLKFEDGSIRLFSDKYPYEVITHYFILPE